MTTKGKCEAILKEVLRRCNEEDARVSFEGDLGGNTLTVLHDQSHTHVGVCDGSWDALVDSLYQTLGGGPGLSWHTPVGTEQSETRNGP